MRKPPDPPTGLSPAGPREWMIVWARVITRPSIKCVGAFCAHFADYSTGAEIHPGNALLGTVCGGMDKKTVISALAQIRDWGLIWRYWEGSKAGRAGMSDVYRLTIPDDIFYRVPLLGPEWDVPVENPAEQVVSRHLVNGHQVVSGHLIEPEQVVSRHPTHTKQPPYGGLLTQANYSGFPRTTYKWKERSCPQRQTKPDLTRIPPTQFRSLTP